jgi:DNA-binding MarR family transcriptional regulator
MTSEKAICDQVVSALRGISLAMDMHYKQLLRDYGLSGPQIIVLRAIHTKEPCPMSEIARTVHLSHATVSAIVDRLERKGLVSRASNERDRREVFISLTSEGIETVKRAPSLLHDSFIAEFTRIEVWEQNQILASLQRVAKMIGSPAHPVPMLSIAPLDDEPQPSVNKVKRERRLKQERR